MKRIAIVITAMVVLLGCGENRTADNNKITDESTTIHVFALMGQSNMVGGNKIVFARTPDERIKSLDLENNIVIAQDPLLSGESIYPELRNNQGVGPGTSFADNMINQYPEGHEILLVHCARNGSSILEQIQAGLTIRDNYYERSLLDICLERTDIAMADARAVFEGVLYWQGESNVYTEFSEWQNGVLEIKEIFERIYGDLEFIFAQIALIDSPRFTVLNAWDRFKENQEEFASSFNMKIVKTDDVTTLYDTVHADQPSQVQIGYRFYKKFIE